MAATANIRLLCEVVGLGEDKKFASLFTDSSTPTEGMGPVYVVPLVTTQVDVELGGMTPQELRGMCLRCANGIFYAGAASSAAVTMSCYITTGQTVYFAHQALLTSRPAVIPFSTTAAYEVFCYGVAT